MKKDRSNQSSSSGQTFGLPKSDILRGRTNFNRLFEPSTPVYSEESINLRFCLFAGAGNVCKMGFIVAKRLGKASGRNRVKRLLKEAYRLNRCQFMDALYARTMGFHGALSAKSINIDFKTAEREVTNLLDRVVLELHSSFDL